MASHFIYFLKSISVCPFIQPPKTIFKWYSWLRMLPLLSIWFIGKATTYMFHHCFLLWLFSSFVKWLQVSFLCKFIHMTFIHKSWPLVPFLNHLVGGGKEPSSVFILFIHFLHAITNLWQPLASLARAAVGLRGQGHLGDIIDDLRFLWSLRGWQAIEVLFPLATLLTLENKTAYKRVYMFVCMNPYL